MEVPGSFEGKVSRRFRKGDLDRSLSEAGMDLRKFPGQDAKRVDRAVGLAQGALGDLKGSSNAAEWLVVFDRFKRDSRSYDPAVVGPEFLREVGGIKIEVGFSDQIGHRANLREIRAQRLDKPFV